MRYCILALMMTLSAAWADAQEPHCSFLSFDDFIETLIDEQEEGDDIASWLEELQILFENPLNLNAASKEDLLRIPFLNELVADNIIEYRRKTGAFFSFFELTSVAGVERELAEKIACFVVVGDSAASSSEERPAYKAQPRHQLLAKGWQSIPRQAGYISTDEKAAAYQGGPTKIYVRYGVQQSDRFQAGITGDRDPGEEFFKGSNKWGFDFYSAHLKLRINHRIPQVIVGDFSVRAGQGLVLWQGFAMRKSAETLSVSKGTGQIRPYTSADENFFFRGIATTLQTDNARLHLFGSRKKSDGNIVETEERITFSSLQTSGYHRTLSEIEDKNSVRHSVAGGIFNYSLDKLKVGANFLYEHFQYPFIRSGQLYQTFLFSGRQNYNVSLDYRFISGSWQFYGEAAVSRSGGVALLQGVDTRLHDQLYLSLLFRHYEKDYHTTWGNGFGEGGNTINETGFYAGFKILPIPKISISAYTDWFRSPWLNYATIGPSAGHDFLFQTDFRPTRKLSGYIRLKTKIKESKTKDEHLYFDKAEKRTNLRFHAKYQIHESFSLKARIESVWYDYLEKESGLAVYQDFVWSPQRLPFNASFRFSWFRTNSYNSRIYIYENDLLYNFSTLSFYGEGIRTYLNLKFSISKRIDVWLKMANTSYFDRNSISSGYSLIEGNKKTDIKVQLRYKF
ncbi:MAG: helix-hairpin-helix domain-containing protein [Prolixibacteraceae bacterium]|nr:helix-hairpin-helix domain-containing protein [Prolixibacteraceae bacterium]